MIRKLLALTLALALLCVGCATTDGPAIPSQSTKPAAPATADYSDAIVLAAQQHEVDQELSYYASLPSTFTYNTASAVLSAADGNAGYSPVSLFFALMMLREGTTGATRECLDDLLDSATAGAKAQYARLYTDDEKIGKLLIANSLWTTDEVTYQQDYIDAVKENFSASLIKTTFGPTANAQMTKWVSDNTGGLLKPTFESDEQTVLELLNAIYLQTYWQEEFHPAANTSGVFTDAMGEKGNVTFMNRTIREAIVWKTANATRVHLDTSIGSMRFILPDEGVSVEALYSDPATLEETMIGGQRQFVRLTLALPKVDISTETDLVEPLKTLGCSALFQTNNPDLSGLINEELPLEISRIRQGVRLIWDEEGVTGGAFTEVAVSKSSMPPDLPELTLRFDRPFVYAATATNDDILFIGTVTKLG